MTHESDSLASRSFEAIDRRDLEVRELYAPGAKIWHNVMRRSQTREENLEREALHALREPR